MAGTKVSAFPGHHRSQILIEQQADTAAAGANESARQQLRLRTLERPLVAGAAIGFTEDESEKYGSALYWAVDALAVLAAKAMTNGHGDLAIVAAINETRKRLFSLPGDGAEFPRKSTTWTAFSVGLYERAVAPLMPFRRPLCDEDGHHDDSVWILLGLARPAAELAFEGVALLRRRLLNGRRS